MAANLPNIGFVKLTKSTMSSVVQRMVDMNILARNSSLSKLFVKLPDGFAERSSATLSSCIRQMVDMNLVMSESMLTKLLDLAFFYIISTFTISFTIFFTLFTFTLFKTVVHLSLGWSRRLEPKQSTYGSAEVPLLLEQEDTSSQPPEPSSCTDGASPPHIDVAFPPLAEAPTSPVDSSPTTPSTPIHESRNLPAEVSTSDDDQPQTTPDTDAEDSESLCDEPTIPEIPISQPTPLPPYEHPEITSKVVSDGVYVDMERRLGSELTHSVYFRVGLPFEHSFQAFRTSPPRSSSYTILSCVPNSTDPDDYRLCVRHPLSKGIVEFEFDFTKSCSIRGLFPEMEDFVGDNFCIRIPNFFQTLVDLINSFAGEFERPADDGDAVTPLSEEMLARDTSYNVSEGWTRVSARDISSRAVAHTTYLHLFDSDEQIRVPTLRSFTFKGTSNDCVLPAEVGHLSFSQLKHVDLESVQISFHECWRLIANCKDLQTLCLRGPRIGENRDDGFFGGADIDETVATKMERLEIHDCSNSDVWPFLRKLRFEGEMLDLVLDLSEKGAESLAPSEVSKTLESVTQLLLPNSIRMHPNILGITTELKRGGRVVVERYIVRK
ncbi:hypothetical protein VNI00_010666 [Paramarasmius palmivorus]|uniref:Uncharacterized protein n=1 Tax=Paramarasmius palmivorus TaxID=297713 RepID=A0AAW0CIF8_9AGAR